MSADLQPVIKREHIKWLYIHLACTGYLLLVLLDTAVILSNFVPIYLSIIIIVYYATKAEVQ